MQSEKEIQMNQVKLGFSSVFLASAFTSLSFLSAAQASVVIPVSTNADRSIVGSSIGDFVFASSIGSVRLNGVKIFTQFKNGDSSASISGFDIAIEPNANSLIANQRVVGTITNTCELTSPEQVSPKSFFGRSPRTLVLDTNEGIIKGRLQEGISGYAFPVYFRSTTEKRLSSVECKQVLSITVDSVPVTFFTNNSQEISVEL
jgi:hypothetical protein